MRGESTETIGAELGITSDEFFELEKDGKTITAELANAGVARVEIERSASEPSGSA